MKSVCCFFHTSLSPCATIWISFNKIITSFHICARGRKHPQLKNSCDLNSDRSLVVTAVTAEARLVRDAGFVACSSSSISPSHHVLSLCACVDVCESFCRDWFSAWLSEKKNLRKAAAGRLICVVARLVVPFFWVVVGSYLYLSIQTMPPIFSPRFGFLQWIHSRAPRLTGSFGLISVIGYRFLGGFCAF